MKSKKIDIQRLKDSFESGINSGIKSAARLKTGTRKDAELAAYLSRKTMVHSRVYAAGFLAGWQESGKKI